MTEDNAAPAGTWLREGQAGMSRTQGYCSLAAVALLALAGLFTLREFLPALA